MLNKTSCMYVINGWVFVQDLRPNALTIFYNLFEWMFLSFWVNYLRKHNMYYRLYVSVYLGSHPNQLKQTSILC